MGLVFGMAQMVVKPPAAALVRGRSSLSPRSRARAGGSGDPRSPAMTMPSTSTSRSPLATALRQLRRSLTISSTRPLPTIGLVVDALRRIDSRPPISRIRSMTMLVLRPVGPCRPKKVQQRHPDGDAVRDLLLDDRLGAVGDVGAISTPSFIGPGCITSAPGCAIASRSEVSAVQLAVADARDQPRMLALALAEAPSPRRHLRVRARSAPGRGASRSSVSARRPSRAGGGWRATDGDVGSEQVSPQMSERATRLCRTSPRIVTFRPSTRPSRSRMVTGPAGLGGVGVPAIAAVDDRGVDAVRDPGRAALGMRITTMSAPIAWRCGWCPAATRPW